MKSFEGYLKLKLGNDYVLLAGGSHKSLDDFLLSTTKYALSDAVGGKALHAYKLYSSGSVTTSTINDFCEASVFKMAYLSNEDAGTLFSGSDGFLFSIGVSGGYGHQIHIDDTQYNIWHRKTKGPNLNWDSWVKILDTSNISPSLNISGNTIGVTVGGVSSSYITVPYATTASTLTTNPSILTGTSDTNKVTITVGGKTSSEYTIPYSTSSTTATVATRLLTNNTSQNADDCYDGIPGLLFYRYNGNMGLSGGDGWIMQWSLNRGSVGQQLYLDDNPSGVMLIRGCNGSDGTTGKPNGNPKFTNWWRLYTDAYHPNADYATSAGNADTLDSIHANGLLTAASLGTNGNNTTLSITVGGTTKTGSVTVPYATNSGNSDTVDSIHATGFLRWKGMLNIGSGAPFQAVVDIIKDTTKLNDGGLAMYSYAGDEYTVLIGSRNDATRHGNALKWGYANRYLWLIRMISGNPLSSDWEKIYAGYADTAGDASTLGGTAKSGLLTAFSLGASGDSTTGSITVGGTTLNSSVTVPYADVSKILRYHSTVDASTIDAFLSANCLKACIFSVSGLLNSNGILIAGGYSNTTYGFLLAIDDDPNWGMALRLKSTNWGAWKKIPMGDGTNASGTWGISITGDADTVDNYHASTLLSAASLGTNGNSTTLSVTVGGTNLTSNVTVPYSTNSGTAGTLLTNNTSQSADACYSEAAGLRFYRYNGTSSTTGQSGGDGWILNWSWNPGSVGGLIYLDDNPSKTICIRGRNTTAGSFTTWATILHTDNWKSYITCSTLGAALADHTHTSFGNLTISGVITFATNDNYGLAATANYSQIGFIDRYFWKGHINNMYSNNISSLNETGAPNFPKGLTSAGDITATNYYTTSDARKKQNISSFSEHIRKFQLKDTEKWHYGVIAQEVPEMFRNGEEGNMTVNYNSVLSYYIGLLELKVLMLEEKVRHLENLNK